MAEVVWFGTEQQSCGICEHAVGVHSRAADGCSHIGSSEWCPCGWFPDREGAARLLDESIGAPFTVYPGPNPLKKGPGRLVTLIPARATFKPDAYPKGDWTSLSCQALVKASGGNYRSCKMPGQFQRWVYLPGGKLSYRAQRQVRVCFTHKNASDLVFEL